jgi:NCS1 family nucleobase:cation symporter-1
MLKIPDLYIGDKEGIYWYTAGYNYRAIIALFVGMMPCLPGFVYSCIDGTIDNAAVKIFQICWFVAAPLSLLVYLGLNHFWPVAGLGIQEFLPTEEEYNNNNNNVIEGIESVHSDRKVPSEETKSADESNV